MDTRTILSLMRDTRFVDGVACPRCAAKPCPRWGRFKGRQRYKCHACRRTFSDLTGTPAAYTKRIEQWWRYACLMQLGKPIRQSARHVDIHPCTAFRWRHVILRAYDAADSTTLAGWIEVGSEWFAYSEKGSRNLSRPARRRGLREPWPDACKGVNVLIAADRHGDVSSTLVGPANARSLYRSDLAASLDGRVSDHATLVMPVGPYGPGAAYSRSHRLDYVDCRPSLNPRRNAPIAHVRTVNAYARRLKQWIRRFRGVATKYLNNYLAWHRACDNEIRNSAAMMLLRWPMPTSYG